jgi:hypothetical protein
VWIQCSANRPRAGHFSGVEIFHQDWGHGTLKTYPGFPHGMPTTHAAIINADILAFIKG